MAGRAITFETVRQLGRQLPGTKEGTVYGSPALTVKGRMYVCMAIHRSAESDTLAARMDFKERDRRLAADPATYYLTPHYEDYPCVLVRLRRLDRAALETLLRTSWEFVASGARVAPRVRKGGRKR
jgi:hypothetical protein